MYRYPRKRVVAPSLLVLLLTVFLGGCASSGAPVTDLYSLYSRNKPAAQPVTRGSYRVKAGDTLYSIAFRYGWNYQDLARANHIPKPYTIHPGQLLRFDRQLTSQTSAVTKSQPGRPAPPARQEKVNPRPATTPKLAAGQPLWQWPSSGKVLSHYGDDNAGKGILIGGGKGSPVQAAAPGVVVYRGSGLSGYGNLLIIKHNDTWLSAYAHNDTMLVTEGETVKTGQNIATLGSTGTWQVQLYFEIRRDGTPVNPETLLPKR